MIKLLYIAPFSNNNIADGYSNASDGMLNVFKKMTAERLIDVDVYNNPYNMIPNNKTYDFCFINANPTLINNNKILNQYKELKTRCKNIYLSIVWESEPYPTLWNTLFDSNIFDGYLCPSLFVKNLLKSKIKAPLFFYPHFIDTDIYKNNSIEQKNKEDFFTVYSCGQLTERKSFIETIAAFCLALGDNDDCKLIVKTNQLGQLKNDIDNEIQKISHLNGLTEAAIYSITNQTLSQEHMIELYNATSLFVLPSKGEGFGLNVYEALSCGVNCLYSDYSAFSSLPKKQLSNYTFPIKGKLEQVKNMHHFGYEKNSKWFYPSLEDLTYKMKESYTNWKNNKNDYNLQGLKNRDYIIKNFSYEPIKKTILNIFNKKEIFYA